MHDSAEFYDPNQTTPGTVTLVKRTGQWLYAESCLCCSMCSVAAGPMIRSILHAVDVTDVFVDDIDMALNPHRIRLYDTENSPLIVGLSASELAAEGLTGVSLGTLAGEAVEPSPTAGDTDSSRVRASAHDSSSSSTSSSPSVTAAAATAESVPHHVAPSVGRSGPGHGTGDNDHHHHHHQHHQGLESASTQHDHHVAVSTIHVVPRSPSVNTVTVEDIDDDITAYVTGALHVPRLSTSSHLRQGSGHLDHAAYNGMTDSATSATAGGSAAASGSRLAASRRYPAPLAVDKSCLLYTSPSPRD